MFSRKMEMKLLAASAMALKMGCEMRSAKWRGTR